MIDRQAERHALAVQVEYRTAGSFLVAYTSNLSRGGMFLESLDPQPVGTRIGLKFSVPGSQEIELVGVVAWIRTEAEGNEPAGMGIGFVEALEEQHGELVDLLASQFQGLRILVMAPSRRTRGQLSREIRSMLKKADVIEASDLAAAKKEIGKNPDLVVIDLDDAKESGVQTIEAAKSGPHKPVPVVVAVTDATLRSHADALGSEELLDNPPSHTDLQSAVVRALGRPSRVV